jgi:DNA primase
MTKKKIKIDKKALIAVLDLKPSGGKGWYVGDCVFCGKEEHMGIRMEDVDYLGYNCFKCGAKGSVIEVLKKIGRTDILDGNYMPSKKEILDRNRLNQWIKAETKNEAEVEEIKAPYGYTAVTYHPYLRERGFTRAQYSIFSVGISSIHKRMEDRIIFLVKEDNKIKGYLGRSTWSGKRIAEHNETAEKEDKHRKYLNSVSDFGKLVFGIDEITKNTYVAICVEGVTDKASVDRSLHLYDCEVIKCVATFGHKMTDTQAKKLARKGIKHLILFYDPDSVSEMIEYGSSGFHLFESVQIMLHPKAFKGFWGVDAGDMSKEDIQLTYSNRVSIVDYGKYDYFGNYKKLIKRWRNKD